MYTRRLAEELLAEEKWDQWVELMWVRPMVVRGEDGVVHVPENTVAWDYSQPQWRAILSDLSADGIVQRYQETLLNNSFLRFVQACENGSALEGNLFKIIRNFLGTYDREVSLVPLPHEMSKFVYPLVTLLRGLAAVLSPIPFDCGSSPKDVDFLKPLSKRFGGSENLDDLTCPTAKALSRRIKKTEFWCEAIDAYRAGVGEEETTGREFIGFVALVEAAEGEEQFIKALSTWNEKAQRWGEVLRKGALAQVSRLILKRFSTLFDNDRRRKPAPSGGDLDLVSTCLMALNLLQLAGEDLLSVAPKKTKAPQKDQNIYFFKGAEVPNAVEARPLGSAVSVVQHRQAVEVDDGARPRPDREPPGPPAVARRLGGMSEHIEGEGHCRTNFEEVVVCGALGGGE